MELLLLAFICAMQAFFMSSLDILLSLAFCLAMQSFIILEWDVESDDIGSAASTWVPAIIMAAHKAPFTTCFMGISGRDITAWHHVKSERPDNGPVTSPFVLLDPAIYGPMIAPDTDRFRMLGVP